MLTCNAVGLCGGSPGDWLRLFSRLTHADNRKREPVRCATLRHAPTDLPANYILAHYITWLFAIIFKWNGRAARTRRRRHRRLVPLLAYPLRNKAICSNTNRSRLREREREESVLFIFFLLFFRSFDATRQVIGFIDRNSDLVEFFSRWQYLFERIILFRTSRQFKMTFYSLYCKIYIYIDTRFSEHEIVHITMFVLGPFWERFDHIHTCAARR